MSLNDIDYLVSKNKTKTEQKNTYIKSLACNLVSLSSFLGKLNRNSEKFISFLFINFYCKNVFEEEEEEDINVFP